MIHLNLLQEDVQPVFTKMPCAEFGGGRVGTVDGFLYEIEISNGLTLVLDEQQLIELVEKALDALPPQSDIGDTWSLPEAEDDDGDDKGEEWKTGGKPA